MSVIQHVSTQRTAELAQGSVQQLARHLAEVRSGFLAGIAPQAPGGNRRLSATGFDDAMGQSEIEAFLTAQPLFQSISAANQALLVNATRARCFRKGDLLFEKGDEPAGLFYVVNGHILLGVSSLQGETKVICIYGVGHSIGEAEIVMDSPYPYFAEAVGDAVVLEIDQGAFLKVLDSDRNFARSLICSMGLRQHDLLFSVESYSLRTATERVVGYLLQHAQVQASGCLMVKLPATKQLIASLLNIKPETLSRIFRDLSDAGLIEVMVLQVEIFDLDRLITYQS
jgi:CRP-like cAMP-binding protein